MRCPPPGCPARGALGRRRKERGSRPDAPTVPAGAAVFPPAGRSRRRRRAPRHAEDLADRLEHLLLALADELASDPEEASFLGRLRDTLRRLPQPLAELRELVRRGLLRQQRVD